MALTRILAQLARQHPRLAVEVRTDQTSVDIVAQGFDAGIRIRRAIQQDMVTTRLTRSFKVILVASRDYLDARGTPKSIADLHLHNCIGIRSVVSGAIFDWELIDGKKTIVVKTSGTVFDLLNCLSESGKRTQRSVSPNTRIGSLVGAIPGTGRMDDRPRAKADVRRTSNRARPRLAVPRADRSDE
jgi:DNA-binding transcriptional LysR family regulator